MSIFWNDAKKDPISHRPALTINPRGARDRRRGSASGISLPLSRCPPRLDGNDHYDVTRQLSLLQTAQGGQQDLRPLQPADGREKRPQGHLPAAVFNEGAAGEPAAQRGWPLSHQRGHSGGGAVAQDQDLGTRDRLPARARADAGLHRRAGGGRSRRHARRHEAAGRRSEENQSAGSRRPRLRSLGRGDVLRHQQRGQEERRGRIPAEPGTLRIPQVVAEVVRQFPRGAAGHRHLPPGQPGISVADGVEQEGQGQGRRQGDRDRRRLSGHAGRHRFPHHHGQRPRRARLGRRRHRGGGGHARSALFDAAAGSHRREVHRQAQGRGDGHRSRAHGHADAAQARRGRQVRGIFRPGPRQSLDRRSRHHRQHVARIRRDLRLLPGRRRYAALSHGYQPGPPRRLRWSPPIARRRASTAPSRRRTRSSPTSSSSNCRRSSPRSPGPSVRRTASRSGT